ncbi:MAG TPA: hypothetical protein VGQ99_12630 [Tepidisphaeraceae bacterium]|jgi:hypothetical protein|nr:hypothetical protein [Tepidisphaeraceae bacterium]
MKTRETLCFVSALTALFAATVSADPLPGEVLLFTQGPMVQTNVFGPVFFGHDEASTAVQIPVGAPFDVYGGSFMADDFAFKSNQSINHLRFWGGYLANPSGENVQKFFISIEADVPQGPNEPFSHPGAALLSQIVTAGPLAPASGTFAEKLIRPKGGPPTETPLFEYNTELSTPFVAAANTVYWLKIVALTESMLGGAAKFQWGWHNRDYTIEDPLAPTAPQVTPGENGFFSPIPEIPPIWHFQDDAVQGEVRINDFLFPGPGRFDVSQSNMSPQNYVANVDGSSSIAQFSKDLAFELYGVPEPSMGLVGIGAAIGLSIRRRRDAAL